MFFPFDAEELQVLMSGTKKIDVEDWKRNTFYKGEYADKKDTHQVVRWFWEEL